jgi:hypothetical protein
MVRVARRGKEIMPVGREARRRQHKRLEALATAEGLQVTVEARRLLVSTQREADRRACRLSGAKVWDLANDRRRREVAYLLDKSGELQEDIDRACADALSLHGGPRVRGSRPLADQSRIHLPQ